jgi:AcrR family transcriptional regulator
MFRTIVLTLEKPSLSSSSASNQLAAPPNRTRGVETRDRLLDAAEKLFAERGFDGASMRALTQAAGVSVSAANYHFGSKEALLRATPLRRVEPLNRRRLECLDEVERDAVGQPLILESILEAIQRPIID